MAFKFEVWPTEYRSINQYFGANPQNYAQFGLPGHEGIDIMAPTGSKIFAVAPGKIKTVNHNPSSHNYGIHVRLEHSGGYETIYAHLEQASVQVGQSVDAGDILGLADNTGNSFGSHLHLTLKKKGQAAPGYPSNIIDPTPYLLPLLGFQRPAGPYTDGWAYTQGITVADDLAQVNSGGINLRDKASVYGRLIDLVPAGTIMIVTGDRRGQYTPVQVPTAVLKNVVQPDPETTPPPQTSDETVDGWGWTNYLTRQGNTAVVGQYGINLRADARRTAKNIGLVRGGSTVTLLGSQNGKYIPVRVRRQDFSGPINVPAISTTPDTSAPDTSAPPAPAAPPSDGLLGWAFTQNLTIAGNRAVSGTFGTNLRSRPSRFAPTVGLFPEGFTGTIVGFARGEYTPVIVSRSILTNIPATIPTIEQPDPLPNAEPVPEPEPIHDTTPGWAFTSQITVAGGMAIAGRYGINLRAAPRRNGKNLGLIPGGASMIVTGPPQGEYTPVRVDDDVLNPPFDPSAPPVTDTTDPTVPPEVVNPDPPTLGQAHIGLHASADPDITDAEVAEFAAMRPGIIKVMSMNNPKGIRKLAAQHPDASWIVRAFQDFREPNSGVRTISPQQFFDWTISDVKRTLDIIPTKNVVIELHNEPNLTPEGLSGAWHNGSGFADWWLALLRLYRQELPSRKFIYPGLSPGSAVANLKQDHVQFIEASRSAVEAADGLGVHIYWSHVYPMEWALNVLDDYISRFRYKPIWITEASNNKSGTTVYQKGRQYLKFWEALQKRPTVQGVTYFVATASNPEFKEEIWVGRGIGRIVGRR